MPKLRPEDHPAFAMAHPHEVPSLRLVPESGYASYGEYVAPSRFWGLKLGLPDIYDDYAEVFGSDHAEIQSDLFTIHTRRMDAESRDAEVLNICVRLKAARPALPFDIALTMKDAATIAHGAVSQFSADDIRFHLVKRSAREDQAWRARKLEVQRLSGGWHFEWMPSHATLDLIEARLVELGDDFDILADLSDGCRAAGWMSA